MPTLVARMAHWLLVAAIACLAAGCAGLPARVERPVTTTQVAPVDTPLPALVRELSIPEGLSAVRPMPMPNHALAARLALIEKARKSIDLQTYLLADDSTGRLVLRALRDASQRGVRVRLLLDDYHTRGLDELLLGLAAHPGVEVHLYNPFTYGRDAGTTRLWQMATDFRRLNQRMHNKLFVADGALAVVGGRNLADDYFLRSGEANFIDFDLLAAGTVVSELSQHFDRYWNSERVFPLQSITRNAMSDDERRAGFDAATSGDRRASIPGLADVAPTDALLPATTAPGDGVFGFFIAPAHAHADAPDKARGDGVTAQQDTVAARLRRLMPEVRSEVTFVSPYFVPGQVGLEHLRRLRERGVEVRVVTNAAGVSDEPIVAIGYERHRPEMLRLGVRLYEVSSQRLKRHSGLRDVLGRSTGRLHAKMGFIDRELFLVGSLNLDARSALINTELGVLVRSPELVQQLLDHYRLDDTQGVYELKLRDDGGIEWTARDADGGETERLADAPESGWWLRMRLKLLSLVVPDELL